MSVVPRTLISSILAVCAGACTPTNLQFSPPRPLPPPVGVDAPVAGAPEGKPELGSFGVALDHGDPSVKPGEDFYRYVNGKWLDTYQLKPDEMRFGSFIKLQYLSEERVRTLVEQFSSQASRPGSIEQQVGDYYNSFMAVDALEEKGIAPLKAALAAIDAIESADDLVDAFGRAGLDGTNSPIAVAIVIDRLDPNRYTISVGQSGVGLPERSYYFEENFKPVVAAYIDNIATMLGFAGAGEEAKETAKKIVALETELAKNHWSRTELRDMEKTNNKQTLSELETKYPSYPWRRHFKAAGLDVDAVKELNVLTPSAIGPSAKLIAATPLDTWKQYLRFHLIHNHAMLLGPTIDDADFAFWGKALSGQAEQRERWRRAMNLIGAQDGLGQALGKAYVERYFPPEAAAKMDELVRNLRAAFKERIEQLTWMGPETKQAALHKLEKFNPKIGFPQKWRDFSGVQIVKDDLLANYRAVHKYWYDDMLSRLGKPTDKSEWFMTPQTINAYYNPAFNEIVFPAAILQPPFFDPDADPAVNYGSIGAVIGHEMGHGFDDQGSRSDADGIQRNWWKDEERQRFDTLTAALALQYDQYEPLPGQKVNGKLTLGENIGDLGGVAIAYQAYQKSLGGKDAPVIDGLTGDQRFFLGWGQLWATKERDEFLLRTLKSDPHSPGQYRVNGVVRNMDAWYEAFDVKVTDPMYIPPDQRIQIW